MSKSPAEYLRMLYYDTCVYEPEVLAHLVDRVGAVTELRLRLLDLALGLRHTSLQRFDRRAGGLIGGFGLVVVSLWLWMARANGQGKNWARILSTVLFGLATLDLFGVLSQPKTALGFVFPVLTWLVGAGAVFLLWRKDSTDFFRPTGKYDPSVDARVKPPSSLQ
jgi:hypothetical protein